ncbi:AlpA family phage regulatory protein [Nitrosomonas sp. HPC101]|uniref:helix-turn-helix transcriptional regulator n=1 Tax=Nitrosomonas sp. HPC101 TaxID=1658667 RepID=UPI00136E03A8|nr:AlpA family phage regulatory protein [Nitrosomonas sp. HPC101]MXS84489.1 AlpA family phage regulatory protein [Nitrosomonas sp. HPC101]
MQTNAAGNSLPSERLLPLDEVEQRVGFKASFIYKQIKNKAFPAPVKIGIASRWRQSEIDSWISSHIAAGGRHG